MNSLTGRAALRLWRPWPQAARVCRKGSVSTKKRGYDITRNPHLNKFRAYPASCPMTAGIGSNATPTLVRISGSETGWMDGYIQKIYIITLSVKCGNKVDLAMFRHGWTGGAKFDT